MSTNPSIRKWIAAINAGIKALEKERRRFSPGHYAYETQGLRPDVLDDEGTKGVVFDWVARDYSDAEKITAHIEALGDLIEMLNDPGPVPALPEQPQLFLEDENDNS
jgi:hypothetical protein